MILNIVLAGDKVGCLLDILGQEKCFRCLQTEKSASCPTKPMVGRKHYILVIIRSTIIYHGPTKFTLERKNKCWLIFRSIDNSLPDKAYGGKKTLYFGNFHAAPEVLF